MREAYQRTFVATPPQQLALGRRGAHTARQRQLLAIGGVSRAWPIWGKAWEMSTSARNVTTALALCALLAALVGQPSARSAAAGLAQPTRAQRSERAARAQPVPLAPNIVLITSDDQTLYDMRWMPRTRHLLGDKGATFTNAFSPHPLCCPARAEILTGQYAQNNGVRTNSGPFGGLQALNSRVDTIGPWLQDAGYFTAFAGKFLHGFFGFTRPFPGWDRFDPIVEGKGLYRYYNFAVSHSGDVRWHRGIHESTFLSRNGAQAIRSAVAQDRPFFLWESHVAPHDSRVGGHWGPPIPARADRHLFQRARPRRSTTRRSSRPT